MTIKEPLSKKDVHEKIKEEVLKEFNRKAFYSHLRLSEKKEILIDLTIKKCQDVQDKQVEELQKQLALVDYEHISIHKKVSDVVKKIFKIKKDGG